ncbi:MAG: ClC family H(+)/Cl(-) exchange transporter [Rhodococcus sp. (in: high G+C Gram-positive bacteria)]|uniref:ClC family H(+)/Cl(-) exchange transporter n=1 Tax=Rhodococcus sp. TaxID=1831 RepID=UPI003BB4DEFF
MDARSTSHSDVALPGGRLPILCIVAVVAGVAIGFVGGAFRWCLDIADRWRIDLLHWAETAPGPAWLVPVAVTTLGATVAALIVRSVPLASGSGIQHVEAVSRGETDAPPLRVLPAKFFGGLAAIGSGMVLGREGPTVHMGAALGAETGRRAGLPDRDVRLVQSAIAGAGLAVAFNAPLGGALFTVEEVRKSFDVRTVVPTLFAVAAAVGCSRLILGNRPDFAVGSVEPPALTLLPLFVGFGLCTGILGVIYNRLILKFLDTTAALTLRRIPPVATAAAIGGAVGMLLVIDPLAAGGGDALSERIVSGGTLPVATAVTLLTLRFVAGPLSYAAGTPGGLFAPLLAVGALWGILFATAADTVLPVLDPSTTTAMALAGMSAFFAATVRAPITGIVLVVEMTATATITVPMTVAVAAAVLVAQLARSEPIYDSLRIRAPFGSSEAPEGRTGGGASP